MNIDEALEFATWSAKELTEALTDQKIKVVKSINVAIFFICFFSFIIILFSAGISLTAHGIVSELSLIQELGLLTFIVLISIGILFLSSFLTVRLAAKLRIMPRRLARLSIKNWKSDSSHVAVIAGISAGIGASGC